MELVKDKYSIFLNELSNKKIVCYGVGKWFVFFLEKHPELLDKIDFIVDSDRNQCGKIKICGIEIDVYEPDKLYDFDKENQIILITSTYDEEIYQEIKKRLKKNEIKVFSGYAINCIEFGISNGDGFKYQKSLEAEKFQMNKKRVIPKKIHYCWFGENELPESALKCIETWKKYCPDYEIIKWNESNFDYKMFSYTMEAYKKKKWAFVSDVARLWAVYNYGGIYLDTDVEVLKPLDTLLNNTAYMGFQNLKLVNTGLGFGAKKKCSIIGEMLQWYEDKCFVDGDGNIDLTPCPEIQTKVLINKGIKQNGEFQVVDDMAIYPPIYFNPQYPAAAEIIKSDVSYSIHHYETSWGSDGIADSWRRRCGIISEWARNNM